MGSVTVLAQQSRPRWKVWPPSVTCDGPSHVDKLGFVFIGNTQSSSQPSTTQNSWQRLRTNGKAQLRSCMERGTDLHNGNLASITTTQRKFVWRGEHFLFCSIFFSDFMRWQGSARTPRKVFCYNYNKRRLFFCFCKVYFLTTFVPHVSCQMSRPTRVWRKPGGLSFGVCYRVWL